VIRWVDAGEVRVDDRSRDVLDVRMVFRGETLRLFGMLPGLDIHFRYTPYPSTNPKTLVMTLDKAEDEKAPDADRWRNIYRLDGDELRICGGSARLPKEFDEKTHRLFVLKRDGPAVDPGHAFDALREAGGKVYLFARPSVSFAGSKISDADLPSLKGLRVSSLDLSGTRVKTLDPLEGVRGLADLDLRDTQVGDPGLARLEEMADLESLSIARTHVTDHGLAHLGGLKRLRNLDLGGTGISDAGMGHLARLGGLRTLTLGGTKVSDTGLKELKGLRDLERLDLSGLPITDAGLAPLEGLEKLKNLTLVSTRVGDAGLAHLKRLTGLQELALSFTDVGDEGLTHLKGLAHLRSLIVIRTRVTDAGAAELRKALPGLAINTGRWP
jgi:uncharacterized protein (TIGR03067 family)